MLTKMCLANPLPLLLLPFILLLPLANTFNLYIGTEEMNRTLGISARMDYVTNGQINEYSTQFPYRVAENISQIQFTWNSPGRMVHYSLRAASEQFDVLPVLLVASEGTVPRKPAHFWVEYRCVGARSGQFQVLLHFNISLRPPLQFTLKQEKICSYIDGRRAFAGEEDDSSSSSAGGPVESGFFAQLLQLPLFCQLLFAVVLVLFVLCSLLLCCCYCLRTEDQKGGGGGGGQNGSSAAETMAAQAFRRRSKIGSMYASTRSSIRMKLKRDSQGERGNARLAVSFGSPTQSNGGGGAGLAPGTTSSLAGSSIALEENSSSTPFLNSSADPQMPSTSTAPFPTGNVLRVPAQKAGLDRILHERPEAQQVDISQALVDLNADRNLFEQAQRPEMEGQFGQLIWANWRQIGATGNRPVVDEVDDEEDDAKEDKPIICKTLKPGAGRVQFERFLRNALQFHHVPAHSHLAQVIAAATFGNFRNPESVKDLPLICYAHDGFGLLKNFLLTCRGQSNKEMDQVSIAMSMGEGMRAASGSREVLKECGRKVSSGATALEQQQRPKIVVTNTSSSALSTCETTLRTHDLCSMAIQIVSAVRHLHKFGIIHKDIATRNCLVSRALLPLKFGTERLRLHVQLSDSALSRDFFAEDYALPPNCANPEEAEPCPVRWMAPELLKHPPVNAQRQPLPHVYNSATDIWAYGVLLWELFTCGQQPYGEMHTEEFAQALVYAGLRLSQPYNCPDELYLQMCQCWVAEPGERPTAAEMDHKLQEFMNRLRRYI